MLCYELALDTLQVHGSEKGQVSSIAKRLGNVQNELGVQYMNQATAYLTQEGKHTLQGAK